MERKSKVTVYVFGGFDEESGKVRVEKTPGWKSNAFYLFSQTVRALDYVDMVSVNHWRVADSESKLLAKVTRHFMVEAAKVQAEVEALSKKLALLNQISNAANEAAR